MANSKKKLFDVLPELETNVQIDFGQRFVLNSMKRQQAFIPKVSLRLK